MLMTMLVIGGGLAFTSLIMNNDERGLRIHEESRSNQYMYERGIQEIRLQELQNEHHLNQELANKNKQEIESNERIQIMKHETKMREIEAQEAIENIQANTKKQEIESNERIQMKELEAQEREKQRFHEREMERMKNESKFNVVIIILLLFIVSLLVILFFIRKNLKKQSEQKNWDRVQNLRNVMKENNLSTVEELLKYVHH